MPNLNSWIEAQLKRGHSKAQVKSFLARKGYSQKAVAQVDRLNAASSSKFSPNPLILILGVVIVAVIIVVIVGTYFVVLQKNASEIAGSRNPIDPENQYTDYEVLQQYTDHGVLRQYEGVVYKIGGVLVELNPDNLILQTEERLVTINKPAKVRYFTLVNNSRQRLTEDQLKLAELVDVSITTNKSTGEIKTLSVSVR